jgi:lipopolysaccharide/colanic/teichoic acid biosynthesis glycosyltransferase
MNTNRLNIRLQLAIKRILDMICALLALIFTSPLLLIIAILVKLDSPGPVIYRHHRVGKNGRPFELYKFRTMVCGGDDSNYMNYLRELIESAKANPSNGKPYAKMKDDWRVTRVGRVLRTYYLDELPQMINVLKGDLSIVGPRPHVQFEVDNYTPEQARRLTVTPGATGLWQVSGKADCTFAELLAYDLEYIDHWSIWLDLQIMAKTILIILNGGEAFWTRTTKRIPRKGGPGDNHRLSWTQGGDCETTATAGGKKPRHKLPRTVKRLLSGRGNRSPKKISSINE